MRIFALFLCTFLLLITLGTLSYVYILWNTYWIRVAKLSKEGGYLRKQNAVRIVEVDPQVRQGNLDDHFRFPLSTLYLAGSPDRPLRAPLGGPLGSEGQREP